MIDHCISSLVANFEMSRDRRSLNMTAFVHSIVIISFKFLFVDRLGPTATLRLRSHGNDIVPLSYRSDFWNGKLDCSHGSGPLSYQFLEPVDTGTLSYRSAAFRAKTSKKI